MISLISKETGIQADLPASLSQFLKAYRFPESSHTKLYLLCMVLSKPINSLYLTTELVSQSVDITVLIEVLAFCF